MTVRVGVIGTGFGARVVAPVFRETEGCEIVDVVSARDDAGVATLCDRDDVDLVSVHSPPFLHTAHVRRALHGEHAVLCDKPFGAASTDAETLVAAADAAECLHLVNFEFRYDPMRVLLRDLVRDGSVGRPEHVSWTHHSAGSAVPLRPYGWLFDRASGGGWVGAWGSHIVDALRWTFGEVVDARGACRTVIAERPDRDGVVHACDAEDAFSAWLTLSGGITVSIDSTFAAPATLAPRIVVVGDEGTLECVADAAIVVRRHDSAREEHERPSIVGDPHLTPMRRWAEVVRDAVEAGIAPPGAPTFADGLACAKVLDQIRAA
ncbi:MAG TPA: Gfo/Idh/MocA family oxidoreductase [Acidimicrobiia bacterium]